MDERSVHSEFRSTLAIPREAWVLPRKSGNRRSHGSCGASRFPSDDWGIHLSSADRGHPAVVHTGIAFVGDRRRVQLSGYDKADDTLATLPINARQKNWRRRISSAAPLFILREFSGVAVRHGEDVLMPIGCNSLLEEAWGRKKAATTGRTCSSEVADQDRVENAGNGMVRARR